MYTYMNYRHKGDNSYFSASFYRSIGILLHIVIHISAIPGADPGIFVEGEGGGGFRNILTRKKKGKQYKQTNKKGVRVWQGQSIYSEGSKSNSVIEMFPDSSFRKYDLAWCFLHTKSTFDMIAFS